MYTVYIFFNKKKMAKKSVRRKKQNRKKKKGSQFKKKKSSIHTEKYQHLKLVRFCTRTLLKKKIFFFPSLIPYQKVYRPKKYGIIPGIPDFCIVHPRKEGNTTIWHNLYIELKVGANMPSQKQKNLMKFLIDKGDDLVSVCYSAASAIKLIQAYLDPNTSIDEIQKLCWAGKTKLAHIMGTSDEEEEEEGEI